VHEYLPIKESLVKDCRLAGVNCSGIYGSVFSFVVESLIFVTLKGEAVVLIMLLNVPSTLWISSVLSLKTKHTIFNHNLTENIFFNVMVYKI